MKDRNGTDENRLLAHLARCTAPQSKRDMLRDMRIKGSDARRAFNQLLRDMEKNGRIEYKPSGGYGLPDRLDGIGLVEVTDIDSDGDVIARPMDWDESVRGPAPRIEMRPARKGHPDLVKGDRVMARIERSEDGTYTARLVRRLDTPEGRVVGVVRRASGGGYFLDSANKKEKKDFDIPHADLGGAEDGDLVVAEIQPSRGDLRRGRVRVREVIGKETDPKAFSLISIHEMGLQTEFSQDALREAERMGVPDLKGREDLRPVPLVTIDGADARDFDDAVFAEETDDGFHLIVAIADVAHYVQPGTALDAEAWKRGNSTYFPDRVVPMLPEKLSNGLCSLRPAENRACLAVHLWLDKGGDLRKYKFVRGLMRSAARLTYEQAQAAYDGNPDDVTGPIMDSVIRPLYRVYNILRQAREKRSALDLDIPERRIVVNEKNEMTGVKKRIRLDSHKLIEEFMVTANVAAAAAQEEHGSGKGMFRVHEAPDSLRVDSAREFIGAFGLSLPPGPGLRPAEINKLLQKANSTPYSHIISEVILRAQRQARYGTVNQGHFGLALDRYTHFTSPIRRYADLEVHRCLIDIFNLGAGGMTDRRRLTLDDTAEHISTTERTSMEAERSAVDRFTAAYLSRYIGAQFEGRIKGVTRFGLFIQLDETGADGFLPARALPSDHYVHDESQHALIGRRSGRVYRLGASITTKLAEADGLTGSTILLPVDANGADIPGFSLRATPHNGRDGGRDGSGKGQRREGRHGKDRRRGGGKHNKFRR